ncbi:MAG: hypothetical protein WCP70_00675 [Methanothrix sp.]
MNTIDNQSRISFKAGEQLLSKVPEITLYFWTIKVLCTTVGETASDFLNVNLNFGLTGTSIVVGILLLIALFFQFRAKRYIPGIYWITVVLISIFGTLVTDNLSDAMNVPLELSTIAFSILLAITFAIWYAKEKTLSIHSIFTRQREAFYWLAILFTFALGTASGDLMAESLGLGYLTTGVIVVATVAFFAIGWKMGLDSVLAFWVIYIMTRPLGASMGDFLSQPQKYGGLDLGATVTTFIFTGAILTTVLFLSITKKDLIAKPSIGEVEIKPQRKPQRIPAIWQTATVICLLLVVSGSGYYWCHSALQAKANILSQADNSSGQATKAPPLGDLTVFKTITQDTLDFVNANNLSGAKTQVNDLEYEWDNSEARLKPMNPTKWTEIDTAIDQVLRQVRAVNPNAATCKSSLQALLTKLK